MFNEYSFSGEERSKTFLYYFRSLSAEISFILTLKEVLVFELIAYIKNRIPTGPIGLPSTFRLVRLVQSFKP